MKDLSAWYVLTPEIVLVAMAVLLLALDLIFAERGRRVLSVMSCLAGPLAFAANVGLYHLTMASALPGGSVRDTGVLFDLSLDGMGNAFLNLLLIAASLVLLFANCFFRRVKLPFAEFNFLVLISTAALLLLMRCQHFIPFFVLLETATTGLCVLAAFNRRSGASLEAGLKYLLAGGLSGALMLFGIVLLYGVAGNPVLNGGAAGDALSFHFLGEFIKTHTSNPLVLVGATLVTVGIVFKIGLVPFQHWVPDVYQGAPLPVTAFFSTVSKIAGVFALWLLLNHGPFHSLVHSAARGAKMGPLFVVLAVLVGLTLLYASITALGQANTKRLMGLSGMVHAAFLVLALLASCADTRFLIYLNATAALSFYAFAYIMATALTFGVMGEVASAKDSTVLTAAGSGEEEEEEDVPDTGQTTTDFQLLRERQPFLCAALCGGLGSLAGVPPSIGFFAKLLVLYSVIEVAVWTKGAVSAGFTVLAALALLSVCGSTYYYFAWMRESFQRLWVPEERRRVFAANPLNPSLGARLLLLVLMLTTLLGGVVVMALR